VGADAGAAAAAAAEKAARKALKRAMRDSTAEDFSALAEHRKKADRDAQLAVTLAAVETLDTEELLEEPDAPGTTIIRKRFKHLIHLHNSQYQDATQGPARR
jgi:hypothetical protein